MSLGSLEGADRWGRIEELIGGEEEIVIVLVQVGGAILVVLAVLDIYLTVLHSRLNSSLLSVPIAQVIWFLFRQIARLRPKTRHSFLSYGGSAILIGTVTIWILLLLLGFALISWPELGRSIQASQGQSPTDFATALYYSSYSLTTLGTGDLVPKTAPYRLLMVLQATLGFSTFTLTITYILSIYSALTRRNTFALSLHHRADDTADSVELLARLAASNDLNNIQPELAQIARDLIYLLESQNTYFVLLYFRFHQSHYALPRILYLSMDTVTLIRSALDTTQYRSVVQSTAVTELWRGGLHVLTEVCQALVPRRHRSTRTLSCEPAWRDHYHRAIERLASEGIQTTADREAGVSLYIALRQEWEPYLSQLMTYMAYGRREIIVNED